MAKSTESRSGTVFATIAFAAMGLIAAASNFWVAAVALLVFAVVIYRSSKPKVVEPLRNEDDFSTSPPVSAAPIRHVPAAPPPMAEPRPMLSSRADTMDVPVTVVPSSSLSTSSGGYRLPAAPEPFGPGRWIPAGQPVQVASVTIPGGMVYVGTSLPTPTGLNDPCLIDTSEAVSNHGDYTERQMSYWPSYSEVSPPARRSYLNWLAGGRCDPEADIGFVFLFFYGLERRAIIDQSKGLATPADMTDIADELRRLLGIYGSKSGSFRRYASELLDWVALAEHPMRLYEKPVPEFPQTFELPLYVRLALGQAAVDGAPVPAHLALAWARLSPNIVLRTPATRCSDEFEQMFAQMYTEAFKPGMVLPRNRTKLKLVYRPASSGFRGFNEITLSFKETPDVTVLTGPARKLQEVVEAATKPLEAYSRVIGKNADARSSLEAWLQLPAALWPDAGRHAIEGLKGRMGEGMVAMSFRELLSLLGSSATFAKDKTVALARALESAEIGFEPDVLSGAKAPKPEDKVVLFALPASEPIARAAGPYLAAALTLQLASAVATADGEFGIKEMGHLRETVLSWTHLTPSQTRRLLAHLRLLVQAPVSLTTLKKKFEPLEQNVKETIAAFMATVAQSDGEVSPAEVKLLEKIYKALGVDAKKVFTDVHAVAAGVKASAATVAKVEDGGFKLDPAKIAALQQDTERVSALLANIFAEAEEKVASTSIEVPEAEGETDPEPQSSGLLGLDEAHSALVRMMLSRPQWSRDELLDVAADLDLMLDGALEHINEAAFDAHDLALFEGEDPVTVNADILEKVEA